ncbi:MAG: type IV secretion system DNA-binding domain-containing protein, partial [Cyanobacteria bacterium J06627_8]
VLASSKEINAARKRAKALITAGRHNAVALSLGTPKRNKSGAVILPSVTWVPEAQRGIAVCGGPGSGKTYSTINPMIQSAISFGYPCIIYDFKYPSQAEVVAGYAAKNGYDIKIFAPGYPESEVCNPLDFLENEQDALSARQIATVMNRNFALNANSSEDKFFSDAGDQLVMAMLMLAKTLPWPDLLTASAILSLPDLPKQIEKIQPKLNHWVYLQFSQLLQLQSSEKTVAGVIGTASKVFSRFLSPELVGAFCGKTTLPIEMEGKKLLVIGMDRRKREAIGPLVATVLHMIVTRNVTMRRKTPLFLSIDELPTLFLPYLVQWLNENRSDGLCTLAGFQNMAQLEKTYGREISRSILGGCATKIIFNPGDHDSAHYFSQYLGEEELVLKHKNKSRGGGKSSTSTSENRHKRHIMEAAQFNKLPTGHCVLVNPGYGNPKEQTSIPLKLRVKVPKRDIQAQVRSENVWPKLRTLLIKRSGQVQITDPKSQLNERIEYARSFFGESDSEAPQPTQTASARLSDAQIAQLREAF